MPRNGSGVYSLPAGSTVTNGDTSDATDVNTPIQDLETDMNTARPVVAGGTGATSASAARTNLGLGTIATQASNSVDIDGGSIDGTPIGANSASTGAFTTLAASGATTLSGNFTVDGGSITLDRSGDATSAYFIADADSGQASGYRIDDSGGTTRNIAVTDGSDNIEIGASGWTSQQLSGSWTVETDLTVSGEISGGLTVGGGNLVVDRTGDTATALVSVKADSSQTSGYRIADTAGTYRTAITQDGADLLTVGSSSWLSQTLANNWLCGGSFGAATIAGSWRATPAEARAMTSHEKVMTPDRFDDAMGAVLIAAGNLDGTGTPAFNYQTGFNTSVTDNGTGDYTVAFDATEPDALFVVNVDVESPGSGTANRVFAHIHSRTTSGFSIRTVNATGTAVDYDNIHLTVIRRTWS